MSNSSFLFRFALIADVQYADIDNAMNFTQTETRGYRDSLQHCNQAINDWKQQSPQVNFIVQLGDLIDGQNSGTYGQGLAFEESQTALAFERVMSLWEQIDCPVYHCIGNHEKYNFTWETFGQSLADYNQGSTPHQHQNINFPYYMDFMMHEGWRGIVINPYMVSLLQAEEEEGYQQAIQCLQEKNPTVLEPGKSNYFKYVDGLDQRFVPFNGGLGSKQLTWIEQRLKKAVAAEENIVFFSHLPLSAPASDAQNIAYDYDILMSLIKQHAPQHVKAVFAGHYHNGGYAQDELGIHHLTVQSPLTHGYCAAYVDVYTDHMSVIGMGAHRSHHCLF